jgi:hypothetical protein
MNKLVVVLLMFPMVVMGQEAPYECDNNYGECGTPEMSGGGNAGGGGSILINNTDLGDTYQSADDYDDDGVEDSYDNCPRKPNRDQFDGDGDGVGDLCDNCRNTHNQNQWDLEGDGIGDLCDSDMDGDRVQNHVDNCLRTYNTDQADIDEDGEGNACDQDIDSDGLDNLVDPCPMHVGDPTEDAEWCSPDVDGDGIRDYGFNADNCPGVHNPEQYDADLDGAGDACDPDLDNDGVLNLDDNCNGVFNHEQTDEDRDGRGDEGCDDHYCFVVYGDEENCLDPNVDFRIYSPSIASSTAETINLRIFANRKNVVMEYIWSIRSRPSGSRTTINHPVGRVNESSLFEYIYENMPTFIPDQPGKYTLVVEATGEFTSSQHEIHISVTGPGLIQSRSGCNMSESGRSGSIPIMLLTLLIVGLLRRIH